LSVLRITLVRTSCLLLEYGGRRLLTDPWFETRMRFLPVFRQPGIPLASVPPLDLVLASHLHPDHFDDLAVKQLNHPGMSVVGTIGTAQRCAELGVGPVVELAPWQRAEVAGFGLVATPAEHTGPPPPEVNFLIEAGPWRIFFGGDARWSRHFQDIGDRLGPFDIALLPMGGTLIFGHRTTMGPADAVRACNALRPRWAIPIHEGGEWMPVPPASWHPGRHRHFVDLLDRSGLPVAPCVLRPGESAIFDEGERRYAWWTPEPPDRQETS